MSRLFEPVQKLGFLYLFYAFLLHLSLRKLINIFEELWQNLLAVRRYWQLVYLPDCDLLRVYLLTILPSFDKKFVRSSYVTF